MSLKDKISIPKYSLSEELMSAISHGVGALLGIVALVLCVVRASVHHNIFAVVSSVIYGVSLITLYTMSTMYHALKVNNAKRVFRIIDHCSIYLLIAGSYTPYTLVTLNGALGWTMFGIIWGVAVLGIILNSIDIKKFKKISLILYLALGWAVIGVIKPLLNVIEFKGFILLLAGGICYTVGAIFYGIGKKKKYMHSIFHFFVVAASILQFFSIYLYVV